MDFPSPIGPFQMTGLTVDFSFNHENCAANHVQFALELDWINSLDDADLGDSLWSICPRELITINHDTQCISYVCDGQFELPSRLSDQQTKDTQEEVIQGVAFDATATGLDLVAMILQIIIVWKLTV